MRKNLLHRSFASCKCQSINVLRARVKPNTKEIIFSMVTFFMLTSSSLVKGQLLPQEFVNIHNYNNAFAVANEFDQLKRFPMPRFAKGYQTYFPPNSIWGSIEGNFRNQYTLASDKANDTKAAAFTLELAKNWNYYLHFELDGAYRDWQQNAYGVTDYTAAQIVNANSNPGLKRSINMSWGKLGYEKESGLDLEAFYKSNPLWDPVTTDLFCPTAKNGIHAIYSPFCNNEVFEIDGMVAKAYMNNILRQLHDPNNINQRYPLIDHIVENTEADVFVKMNHDVSGILSNGEFEDITKYPVVDMYTGGDNIYGTSFVYSNFENLYGPHWADVSNTGSYFNGKPGSLLNMMNRKQSQAAYNRIQSYLKPVLTWDQDLVNHQLPTSYSGNVSNSVVCGDYRYASRLDPPSLRRNPLAGATVATYNNIGENSYYPHWDIFKHVMTPINGKYHSTSGFYPRNGMLLASAPQECWQRIAYQKEVEELEGDAYFSPFVCPGLTSVEMMNIRPAPYLALLKALSVAGADFFYTYYGVDDRFWQDKPDSCSLEIKPRIADHASQFVLPVYAQAVMSLIPNFYFNSTLCPGDYAYGPDINGHVHHNQYLKHHLGIDESQQKTYRFTNKITYDIIDPLIVARRSNNDYLIFTSLISTDDIGYYNTPLKGSKRGKNCVAMVREPLTPVNVELPVEFDLPYFAIDANLENAEDGAGAGSIILNARGQGSVYMLKEAGGAVTQYERPYVLIQMDAWHEWKHPYHWSEEIVLEPEHDPSIIDTHLPLGVFTERPAGAAPNDYSTFTTYVNGSKTYDFDLPLKDNISYTNIAVVTRGTGQVTYTLTDANGMIIFTGTLAVNSNSWQSTALPFQIAGPMSTTYTLSISSTADFDKLILNK